MRRNRTKCPAAYKTPESRAFRCKRLNGPCICQYYCKDEERYKLSAGWKNCTVPERIEKNA